MKTAVLDMLGRSRKAQEGFSVGTSQHTLQKNRIAALEVALELLGGGAPSPERLQAADAPLRSLLSKSEKTLEHFTPDKWQHKMLSNNITALRHALTLLENELNPCRVR